MKRVRLAAIATALAVFANSPMLAQGRSVPAIPAEFPPASYEGRQYVDSSGCIFVRAGVGGNVTWVPRLSRDRKQLCGFQPTRTATRTTPETKAGQQTASATPRPKPSASVAKPSSAQPARSKTTAQQPRRARSPATMEPMTASRPKANPGPATVAAPVRQPHAPRATRLAEPAPGGTACATRSGVSAAYTVQRKGSPIRCGPQKAPHVTYVRRATASSNPADAITARRETVRPGMTATRETVSPRTRIAPAGVYSRQRISQAGVRIPPGMEAVWDDDRLNPKRAHQTFEGIDRSAVMWTNTVPRRLIDRRTGADAIHRYPGLQPPYTSFEAQRAAGITVATQGRVVPEPQTRQRVARTQIAAQRETPSTRATVSTRSSAPDTPVTRTEPASHRYAQVGIFADQTQAKAAAQRIVRSGLPARRGNLTRDGRSLTLVLAGPFSTQAQLTGATKRLRSLGFSNVTLRK